MPSDDAIFKMSERERTLKKARKQEMRKLKIHQKTTCTSKLNAKNLLRDEEDPELEMLMRQQDDNTHNLNTVTQKCHIEKENLAEFIEKKREMFLVQYSLGVKREEMRKLEEIAQAEEQKLLDDEKALEEDAAKFDAFLKENDKNSVEAIKRAETETKAKLEKVGEIKKVNTQILAMKSEMSKNEDQLQEYQMYREFLEKLTPKDWLDERKAKRRTLKETKAKEAKESREKETKEQDNKGPEFTRIKAQKSPSMHIPKSSRQHKMKTLATNAEASNAEVEQAKPEEEEEEPELFFTDPRQLLDIFAELEEQNLTLIQNSQETEESLEELKQKMADTKQKMTNETNQMGEQIEHLKRAIAKENDKSVALEERSKFFSFGDLGTDDQEKQLTTLNKKVEEVYRNCIGDNEASIGTLQMLTNIENKLEELFETIEILPEDRVIEAERLKDKERRQRVREEKLETQRQYQEERVKRALERAKALPRKKAGKQIVFRSAPPEKKKKRVDETATKNEEYEEHQYFFHT